MWFKKQKALERRIDLLVDFQRLMIHAGTFDGCIGAYVRTIGNEILYDRYGEPVPLKLPAWTYRITKVNDPEYLTLQDCNGNLHCCAIENISRFAFDDEISDFKRSILERAKTSINKS